jgi:SAM-dependent methyltransferase
MTRPGDRRTLSQRRNERRESWMTTTGEMVVGNLWGARARDFTIQEPRLIALYEAVLEELALGPGTRLLDVGCGPGLFLRLAAQRGATVSGIDAAAPFVEIARERVPDAELVTGDMETLPFEDGSFDAVTSFDTFHLAAEPAQALREAGRVGTTGCPIVIATWGRPDQCEAAGYVNAVGGLLPPQTPSGPFALSEPGAIEELAAQGGLAVRERRDIDCVWDYPDEETALRALCSTGFAVQAIETVGEEKVTEAILASIAPYRTSGGGYRLENVFGYVVTHKEG